MNCQVEVVTDGRIEVRGDWDAPDARLFWRPLQGAGPAAECGKGGEDGSWQPSIYTVGSFDHDSARALRVMSALWHFLQGVSPRA